MADAFVDSLVSSSDIDTNDIEVTCVYRQADLLAYDLLQLSKRCTVEQTLDGQRRLTDSGLGINFELTGDDPDELVVAVQTDISMVIESGGQTVRVDVPAAALTDVARVDVLDESDTDINNLSTDDTDLTITDEEDDTVDVSSDTSQAPNLVTPNGADLIESSVYHFTISILLVFLSE